MGIKAWHIDFLESKMTLIPSFRSSIWISPVPPLNDLRLYQMQNLNKLIKTVLIMKYKMFIHKKGNMSSQKAKLMIVTHVHDP